MFAAEIFFAGRKARLGSVARELMRSERGFGMFSEELRNPNPVSGAGPQFFVVCSTPMRVS